MTLSKFDQSNFLKSQADVKKVKVCQYNSYPIIKLITEEIERMLDYSNH